MKKGKIYLFSALMFLFGLFVFTNTTNVKADSAINNYIMQNQFQPATIQNREGTFSYWDGYENGVGKPEGVVVHETATPYASAEDEVTYFNREWSNAYTYVHAFVDANETINIHDTDYTVWGAGPTANAKYVQIELCREYSQEDFAKSLVNDAYYIASKLIQYNLPDIPGQTVLSHHQVSNMYGETSHVDPDTYFSVWGYDMDQFNALISTFYNNLKATGNVYSAANNAGDTNANPADVIGVKNNDKSYVPMVQFEEDGRTTDVTNRALANDTYWVTDQTKTFDGHNYYRVSTNEWVQDTYVM